MIRAFVALPLPETLKDTLEALQAGLPAGRASARETLHLTLAFAGEHLPETIEALHEELGAIQAPAFEVNLCGLGTFGKGSPKLLYADVRKNPTLEALSRQVKSAIRRAGITPSGERYRPHVTLARFRRPPGPEAEARLAGFISAHAGLALPPFRADAFALYRSTLRPGTSPLHEALASYPLIAPPAP